MGFSGSRQLGALGPAVSTVALAVPPGVPVVVGCARGVDQLARSLLPRAEVFQASAFGSGVPALVRRSAAVARSLAGSGLLLAFPAGAAPAGLAPSPIVGRCFCGAGSGTWATVALALGLGVPVALYLPGVPPPPWGFSPLGGGWHLARPVAQGSLF